MKIDTIHLDGFRSHRSTVIAGLGRVAWFVGENNAGKSSIIDAILYCLTGVCRGTDEAGRQAADLISVNRSYGRERSGFRIVLETDRGTFERVGPAGEGPKSATQKQVNAVCSVPYDTLRLLMETSRFLDMGLTEQRAALLRICEPVLSLNDIAIAVGPRAAGRLKVEFKYETYGQDECETIDRVYRNKRPELKAQIAAASRSNPNAMDAFPPELRGLSLSEAQAHHTHWAGEVDMAAAAARTAARANATYLASIKNTEESLRALQEAASQYEEWRAELTRINEATEKTGVASVDWIPGVVEAIAAHPASCVVCKRVWSATKREQVVLLLNEATRQDALRLEKARADTERAAALKRMIASFEADRPGLDALPLVLARAKQMADDEAAREKAAMAREAAAREKKEAIGEYIAVLMANPSLEDIDALKDQLEDVESVIQAVGPSGLRMKAAAMKLGVFVDLVNEVAKGFGMEVAVPSLDPYRLTVNGRPPALLSKSERFRIGLAVQHATAQWTGMSLLLLDDVDILDAPNRQALVSILNARSAQPIQQAIVCSTVRGRIADFKAPRIDGWTFYSVTNTDGWSTVKEVSHA